MEPLVPTISAISERTNMFSRSSDQSSCKYSERARQTSDSLNFGILLSAPKSIGIFEINRRKFFGLRISSGAEKCLLDAPGFFNLEYDSKISIPNFKGCANCKRF